MKEAVGKATGNEKLQAEGVADKAAGSGKETVGKAKDAVHKATINSSIDVRGRRHFRGVRRPRHPLKSSAVHGLHLVGIEGVKLGAVRETFLDLVAGTVGFWSSR